MGETPNLWVSNIVGHQWMPVFTRGPIASARAVAFRARSHYVGMSAPVCVACALRCTRQAARGKLLAPDRRSEHRRMVFRGFAVDAGIQPVHHR